MGHKNKAFIIVLWVLLFMFPGLGIANAFEPASVDTTDVTSEQERTVVLDPSVNPAIYDVGSDVVYILENGLFFGRSHIGIESTYLQSNTSMYGNFFAGMIGSRQGQTSSGGAWVSGLSVGQQIYLRNRNYYQEDNRVIFYFRAGPGVGLGGRGALFGSDVVYHFGLHTNVLLGAQLRFSDRSAIYMHGGGRLLWFPSMDEIGFMGVPAISLGFRFAASPGIDPVRY